MSEFPIPIVALGAGSQPEEESVDYLPMPGEMSTFSMPFLDLEASPEVLAAACGVIERLRDAMQAGAEAVVALDGLPGQVIELINQTLGHGEVSVRVQNPDLHIQETVFAGVWRVQQMNDAGAVLHDRLHAAAMPPEVARAAMAATSAVIEAPPVRAGMMNAQAILNELLDRSRTYRAGEPAHVINLSLLPVSPEDLDYLACACGPGAVAMLSRGYGNCRVVSTRIANVWWVQYFNSMDRIILNTLEVVDMPETAMAAEEDYQESIARLGEWLLTMREA